MNKQNEKDYIEKTVRKLNDPDNDPASFIDFVKRELGRSYKSVEDKKKWHRNRKRPVKPVAIKRATTGIAISTFLSNIGLLFIIGATFTYSVHWLLPFIFLFVGAALMRKSFALRKCPACGYQLNPVNASLEEYLLDGVSCPVCKIQIVKT